MAQRVSAGATLYSPLQEVASHSAQCLSGASESRAGHRVCFGSAAKYVKQYERSGESARSVRVMKELKLDVWGEKKNPKKLNKLTSFKVIQGINFNAWKMLRMNVRQ